MGVTESFEGGVAGGEDDWGWANELRGGRNVEWGREGGGGKGGPGKTVEKGRGTGQNAGSVGRRQSGWWWRGHEGLAEGFSEEREVRRRGGGGGLRGRPAVMPAGLFGGPAHDRGFAGTHLVVSAGRREGHCST
jgi:hypothetical protein